MSSTFYFYVVIKWDGDGEEEKHWVSVGDAPEPNSIEDQHTLYHFDIKEWNRLVWMLKTSNKKFPSPAVKTSGDFRLVKVIGGGDV